MTSNDAKFVNAIFKGTQSAINRDESFYSIKQTQAAVTIILRANANINIGEYSEPCKYSQLVTITNDPNFQCQILFCKRAQSKRDIHSGQICFPGGKVEQGENDLQGAIRETLEEVGIKLEGNSLYLGRLPNNFNVKQNKKQMSICCHVFLVGQDIQIKMNTDEIEICKWIPLKYFENLEGKIKLMKLPQFFALHMIDDLFGNLGIPLLIKKISEQYKYGYMSVIDIEMNYPLMGYTHQILAQLFNLVFQIDQSISEQNSNWKMIIQCTTLLHMEFDDKHILGIFFTLLGKLSNWMMTKLYQKYRVMNKTNIVGYLPRL